MAVDRRLMFVRSKCVTERYRMDSISQSLQDEISELLRPHRVCLVRPVLLSNSTQTCEESPGWFVVLSLWRGYLVMNKQPVRVNHNSTVKPVVMRRFKC